MKFLTINVQIMNILIYSVYEALWAFASSRGYNSSTMVPHPSKDEFMKIMRNRYK